MWDSPANEPIRTVHDPTIPPTLNEDQSKLEASLLETLLRS